jgi:hypothetical protein
LTEHPPFRRLIARWGPFLVPPLYLAVIFWLQPRDRLGPSDVAPWLGRLLHDDYDGACMALRALNDLRGRQATQFEHPPLRTSQEYSQALDTPADLKPGYYLEYPHVTLLMFRLGYVLAPDVADKPIPAALLDGWHNNLVEHAPRNDSERALWREFRQAIRTYEVIMMACLLGVMAVLTVGYEPSGGRKLPELHLRGLTPPAPVFLLVLPAVLYFSFHRFDIVPTLLVALSLFCLGRRWLVASAILLATATMVKVFPLFLAPIVVRYLSDSKRNAVLWLAAYGATMAAIVLPTLVLSGWTEFWMPYRIQLARDDDDPWSLYGRLLPQFLHANDWIGKTFRMGSALVVVVGLCWTRPTSLTAVLRRGVVAVWIFVTLQVFYSPQWLLWFLPLLIPLARTNRLILSLAIALDVVTYLGFPMAFGSSDPLVEPYGRLGLIYARVAIWAWLLWALWVDGSEMRDQPRVLARTPASAR